MTTSDIPTIIAGCSPGSPGETEPRCDCAAGCGAGCACCDSRPARRDVRRVTVPIFGLGCGGAGFETVERALAATPGVLRAYVNPATEMAYVEFDGCACGTEALKDAVRRAGLRPGHPGYR